ncbi:MAG: 3-hydroxyacyl-CoA dehydrogenase NAD-binding domain-containing protein [Candidatus Aminicenantaceae bacterium]
MENRRSLSEKKVKGISWNEVEILVVGAGTMGTGLVQAYAQSGFTVGVLDVSDGILERALKTIDSELEEGRKGGIFQDSQVAQIKGRILATTDYKKACQGQSLKLAIETATEDIKIKKQIFRTLDKLCSPYVVLASNTSSLDVNILARETKRPDKVVWMHYFFLPHKNRAGEYAGTESTSPDSIEIAAKYMKLAGKVATPILSSRKGGAADVIFVSLLLEAARMVDDGFDVSSIEAAGKKAFNMPLGFLSLMDANGIPLGIQTMYSFSDSSNPDDPLYKVYNNFFTPSESYKKLLEKYQKAEDKSGVRWITGEEAKKESEDMMLVDTLKKRFLAVGFMTAVEAVEAGVIEMEEVETLCHNAFLWRDGPFTLMNKMGIREGLRIVTERMELSHRKEINFPIPQLLIEQAQKNEPWPIRLSSVKLSHEQKGKIARIMISNPRKANALDKRVFEDLKSYFKKTNEDEQVQVIIFDTSPIKSFIAGVNVSTFIQYIREGDVKALKDEVASWQDVVFHEMTGGGKPKIAIVDGTALGGGVEVALAFASDPDTVVIATERTSYNFPETRLGIYPVLRGTLTLPQLVYRATNDADLAVAIARYYILTGATTSSPRVLKYLGLADFLVPSRMRDDKAEALAQAIINKGGKPLEPEQIDSLKIEEFPSELTIEEKEELSLIKNLFLKKDFIPDLYAYSRGQGKISLSAKSKATAEKIAQRVARNSPHAVAVANELITRGFDDFLKGKSLEERAQWELDYYLILTFQHHDALERNK